jgi:hypothetical protein
LNIGEAVSIWPFEKIFLNPPSAPLFQRGERGDFLRIPYSKKGDEEEFAAFFK